MNTPASLPGSPAPAPRRSRRGRTIILGAAVAVAAAILFFRSHERAGTAAAATPAVAVAPVTRQNLYQELSIEAEFRPYQQVELYSKVAGYLKSISVDFGDQVKAGQVIATIEVPELQDELDQATAAERSAAADYRGAHLDYTRLADVMRNQPNLVAQQDLDNAEARDGATAAAVAGAKADVEKYQTLFDYTKITVPFDGVITARSADPGAMIQAASSTETQALPIVRLSENQLLRLDFPVSVSYATDMAVGDPVEVHLDGSDRVRSAIISRFTRDISMSTRTMITEVEVPNPDLKLIPGMYATVILKLHRQAGALAVPIEAVGNTGSPTVYLVNSDNVIEERPVKLGLETASYYEILQGLREGDLVVTGSRSGIQPGTKVVPQIIAPATLP